MAHIQAQLLISLMLLLQAVSPQNSTSPFTAPPTLIPLLDTYISVIENVLSVLVAFPLLLLSTWTTLVILIARALRSNFVYHVLSLAIADLVVAIGDIVGGIEIVFAPNSWGGLSSSSFSPEWATFGSVIACSGSTQHFLVMAIIAVDRLYSVLRPVAYKQRAPPVMLTVAVNVFFAANIVATACCFTIGGEFTNSEAYSVAVTFNEYLAATLVFSTVLLYIAIVIAVRRNKKNVGPQNTTNRTQKEITQTVAKVAVVYVVTAFTSTVALLVLNQLSNSYLLAVGTYDAASSVWFILMTVGQFADLSIFVVKIDAIAEPSGKYMKKLRRCGRAPAVDRPQGMTRERRLTLATTLVTAPGGDIQLVEVQN